MCVCVCVCVCVFCMCVVLLLFCLCFLLLLGFFCILYDFFPQNAHIFFSTISRFIRNYNFIEVKINNFWLF